MGSGEGMEAFITSLTTGLDATTLWGAIAPCAALIIILVLFALGRRVLNKNIKSAGRGTGGKI